MAGPRIVRRLLLGFLLTFLMASMGAKIYYGPGQIQHPMMLWWGAVVIECMACGLIFTGRIRTAIALLWLLVVGGLFLSYTGGGDPGDASRCGCLGSALSLSVYQERVMLWSLGSLTSMLMAFEP